eukprot:c21259_g1_i1.p1 GENE.c21259_g1_i1~~c21259_g1_i1.p1  ORF type:complete len:535 (+),score=229.68 c21259_g1_i1:26-1606(+)
MEVNPLLTDLYQITMAFAYFKTNRHNDHAVFDLFFRTCPFGGEYAVFSGLETSLKFIEDYKFTKDQIDYLRTVLPSATESFFEYLSKLDTSSLKVYGLKEGSVCFPRIPILRIEGPLALCQLLETTLLNLINYATLAATNARRLRVVSGPKVALLEFGLRRAQGPDGAMTAARSSYVGGFDATSNVLAAFSYGMQPKGTHAHAYICSFNGWEDIPEEGHFILKTNQEKVNFVELVKSVRNESKWTHTHQGELAAMTAYAIAFPAAFVGLVDTYDTLESGVRNVIIVSIALHRCGYKSLGMRLDSGDLAELSKSARKLFQESANTFQIPTLKDLTIFASDDITEERILEMNAKHHEINSFGIGTHYVTCKKQPALGGVYKLVQINGRPCIKLSQDAGKSTLPAQKNAYRLYDADGKALCDLLTLANEEAPKKGSKIEVFQSNNPTQSVEVTVHQIDSLYSIVFENKKANLPQNPLQSAREECSKQVSLISEKVFDPKTPQKYSVFLSQKLVSCLSELREGVMKSRGY